MKLTAILLLSACLQVSANGFSQDITLSEKNTSLQEIFKQIHKQTGYQFFYQDEMLNKTGRINIKVKDMPLEKVLAICFEGLPFTYSIANDAITVKPKKEVDVVQVPPPAFIDVHGTVTDAQGNPLSGVSVIIKGNKGTGTNTNSQGVFSLSASKGDVLVFSSVGYESREVTVGNSNNISVSLVEKTGQMTEVVVTALGISRQKKSLTYSVQTVDNSALNDVKDANLINNLTGRVAGVNITQSASGIGGSVRVVIRGNKSTRENQPLYVIDGVPMANVNPGQPSSEWGYGAVGSAGVDGGDGISNLNPEDIQSITVLKGASAAALYGSQAANGVIVINTKKGKAGATKINVSSDITFDKPILIQPLQFKYGQTLTPSAGNPGSNDSWGGVVNAPDHVTPFFQTGVTSFNTVSLSGGTDKSQSYFSYSYTDNKGIMPTASLKKHNINFHQTTDFFNGRLKADLNVMYIHEFSHNRPVSGFYNNALSGLYEFPRGLNFGKYRNNFKVFSQARNFDVQNWWNVNYDSSVIYSGGFQAGGQDQQQNPYWLLKQNSGNNILDRVMTNFSLNFKINDWLNLQARGNIDKSANDLNYNSYATTAITLSGKNGAYDFLRLINTQLYGDLILNANRKLSNDLSLQATLGASINDMQGLTNRFGTMPGGDGLRFANVFILPNILPAAMVVNESRGHSQMQAVFATAQLNWKDYLFFDLTGRNDWSSTFAFTPVEKKGYFYYSAGLTGVLSDILKMPEAITYSKVRVSYARVGNAVPSYKTNPIAYTIDNQNGSVPNSAGPKPGTYLKPEDNRSFEAGTEWSFVNNKVGFDFTYYINNNFRQYIEIPVSAGSTGNLSTWYLNSGNIKNNGVELSVFATPVKTSTVNWTTTINYAANKNKIVKIADAGLGVTQPYFVISDIGDNLFSSYIKEGGSWGDIYGYFFKRDVNGAIVVDNNGAPIKGEDPNSEVGNSNLKKLGNPNPKFTLGWSNSFTIKNFKVNFLFDGRFGGKVMSMTESILDALGDSKATGEARDAGGVKINAVHEDGSKLSSIDPKIFYRAVGGRAGIGEYYMYDATNIRLRELSIGYSIPVSAKWVKNFTVSLIGRNLFFVTKKAPFDPETSMSTDNGMQGIDTFGNPVTRSMGVSVKLGF